MTDEKQAIFVVAVFLNRKLSFPDSKPPTRRLQPVKPLT
jgi:hypothetical protein